MTTITIAAGAKEGAFFADEPGSYAATLLSHERKGPFDDDKKPGEKYYMLEWAFAVEGQPEDACMVWYATSENTGPRSNFYGLISALFGGREAPIGTTLDIETQLYGREALLSLYRNEQGYMKVRSVTPLPAQMSKGRASATPVPTATSSDINAPF